MKPLNINGRQILYKLKYDSGDYGCGWYADFYEGTTTSYRKRFFLFGPVISRVKPKFIFTIRQNIESDVYTKEDILILINKELLEYDIKLKRRNEIKKGNLI